MTTPALPRGSGESRRQWVRMRTLIFLRWLAVAGQLMAITVADRWLGLQLDLGLCYLAVSASVLSNLVSTLLFPGTKRLSETEAMLTLLFDITQLAFLLYLTGGLTNPFALLMLVPVTISASVLGLRTTAFLGSVAIAMITLLSVDYVPLRFADGTVLAIPPLFAFGFWLALVIGIVFLALYAWRVATEISSMSEALQAAQMALAREQKLTDLGGVVAAAAHEMGTPLATIKLASTELANDLQDRPEAREDALLIRQQADRCRDILRSMGRAGKDDTLLRQAPLEAVLQEAAEPHLDRGRAIDFDLAPMPGASPTQPVIQRRPETVHGLRNLIQNAVDFANTRVWIEARWSATRLRLRIIDDGPGFSPQVMNQIGEPYIGRRREPTRDVAVPSRPGYDGMGLGLFIAKTLLERSGARLDFANAAGTTGLKPGQDGAVVTLDWPLDRLLAPVGAVSGPNPRFDRTEQ